MAMHRGDFTKIDIVLNSILSTKKLRKVRAPSLFSWYENLRLLLNFEIIDEILKDFDYW